MVATQPVRHFVPVQLDISDITQLAPLYQQLIDRPIDSAGSLEKWLLDSSELDSAVDEYFARRYIDKSCHTDDPAIEKAYMHAIEVVEPAVKPLYFKLQKKYLACPYRSELTDPKIALLNRKWECDVELFREENIPLDTQATKLVTEYDKTSGAMMVTFRGKEYTLPQLARFIEEPDRAVREEAWTLMTHRRLVEREKIDNLYSQLVPLRQKIAQNAGLGDHRAYQWKAKYRFDYTHIDCLQFADAIAECCVPLVRELDNQRAKALGLDHLRPWDLAVDPKNRPPLRPFAEDQVPVFVQKVREMFNRVSPALANDFDSLSRNNNLDLASRKGKQPGGYQYSLQESRQPFIFMNAAGLQRDVETLLHEGGHAFHCLAAADEPLSFLRSAPMEFCEVASMSMEALGAAHYDVFYNPADAARAARTYFEGVIRFFPWMAVIDVFQHWIYTHPAHTVEERTQIWTQILNRFSGNVDWSGFETARQAMWQRQLHLFHSPFYYVEYGIAQLGALQIWMKSRNDPAQAVANYRSALKLGGTRSLPDLFAAAGIQFDFSRKTIAPLMKAIGDELARLPD